MSAARRLLSLLRAAGISPRLFILLAVVAAGGPLLAGESPSSPPPSLEGNAAATGEVGVEERLGIQIPLDLPFTDEDGRSRPLGEYITKPTLILLLFYSCPSSCGIMTGSLSEAVAGLTDRPLEDYRILSVSFDDEEDPFLAKRQKESYGRLLPSDFPPDAWRYLTGPRRSIDELTKAVGYGFQKMGSHSFAHPNALLVVSDTGKTIRYLYGPHFLAFDIGMALNEARAGTPGLSIRKLATYCFAYDPKNKTYVFKTMRIFGTATLAVLVLFIILLGRRRKDARKGNGTPPAP